jgi:hypothetical protein
MVINMKTGDTIFGDNEGIFDYINYELALEIAWHSSDKDDTVLTIFEGRLGVALVDDFSDFDVTDVKERRFRVIRNGEDFDINDFEEITER